MSVLNDSCMETLIPENYDFFPKCDTRPIGTQTTKKYKRKRNTKLRCYHKEQVYSDCKHYHLNYNKHSNNVNVWNQGKRTTLVSQVLREQ